MTKLIGLSLLMAAAATSAFATSVPEIDGSSTVSPWSCFRVAYWFCGRAARNKRSRQNKSCDIQSEEKMMSRLIGFSLLLMGAASVAFAGTVVTPEIDGASAASAIVLLSGGLLILRARRKK